MTPESALSIACKAEELSAKATPGPWEWSNKSLFEGLEDDYWHLRSASGVKILDDGSACGEYNQEIDPQGDDAAFIAFARTALPILAKAVLEAADWERRARKLAKLVETWLDDGEMTIHEDEDCPEDDTCRCASAMALNDAFKGHPWRKP